MTNTARAACTVVGWGLVLASAEVRAHQVSESYLLVDVAPEVVRVQCEVAVRDLQYVLDSSRPAAGSAAPLSTSALPAVFPDLPMPTEATAWPYVEERLRLDADGQALGAVLEGWAIEERRGIPYAIFSLAAPIAPPVHVVEIDYGLFFEDDPKHHAVLYLTAAGREQTSVLDLSRRRQRFDLTAPGRWDALTTFSREGVRHIWAGHDHLLFLLVLLLPAVLRREGGRLEGAIHLRGALTGVVKVVTAFTVAHSITLSLAALRLLRPPTAAVEVLIAVSVLCAAFNNLRPWMGGREWVIAFGFGLVHGFGFAGILVEMGLPAGALMTALAGFNLGVEAGQLAIVAVFVPLAFAARRTWLYRNVAYRLGSVTAAGVAVVWILQRALGVFPGA